MFLAILKMGSYRSTCNILEVFRIKSKDIFDFTVRNGVVEEQSDEDKWSSPIDVRIMINYHH